MLFDENWLVAAVFDGHGGKHVAEYASKTLVPYVFEFLNELDYPTEAKSKLDVVRVFIELSITNYDEELRSAVIDACPSNPNVKVTPAAVFGFGCKKLLSKVTTEQFPVGKWVKVGSCVTMAFYNPARHELIVSNLGDCRAVLATSNSNRHYAVSS